MRSFRYDLVPSEPPRALIRMRRGRIHRLSGLRAAASSRESTGGKDERSKNPGTKAIYADDDDDDAGRDARQKRLLLTTSTCRFIFEKK